jgi:hypothetical protein
MRAHGGSLKSMQINLICARLDKETDDWPAVHSDDWPAVHSGGYLRYAQARANYRASEADDCRRPGARVRRLPMVSGDP